MDDSKDRYLNDKRNIDIIGVQIDFGASRKGVAMGPLAIRYAGLAPDLRAMGYKVRDKGDIIPPEDGMIEAHRKYADMQIMLDGGESVYYRCIDGLAEAVPYKDDIVFYENGGQPLAVPKGTFYIVLPQDGHMPCRHINGQPGSYRKIVLKVRL